MLQIWAKFEHFFDLSSRVSARVGVHHFFDVCILLRSAPDPTMMDSAGLCRNWSNSPFRMHARAVVAYQSLRWFTIWRQIGLLRHRLIWGVYFRVSSWGNVRSVSVVYAAARELTVVAEERFCWGAIGTSRPRQSWRTVSITIHNGISGL